MLLINMFLFCFLCREGGNGYKIFALKVAMDYVWYDMNSLSVKRIRICILVVWVL